jgi:acetate---CoA ligase (ADP-forming) subunit beta
MLKIIQQAIASGKKTLSEYESGLVIKSAGVEVVPSFLARTRDEAFQMAEKIGFPVVMKGCSAELAHKTEAGMVKLNVGNSEEAALVFDELMGKMNGLDGVLIQKMVKGSREFVIGLSRDPQFGPCVMFGLGGIFTEALKDVTFRVTPLSHEDALEMIDEIKTKKMLGEFRGSPAVDREALAKALVGIGELGMRCDSIAEIDINPLIISGNKPVAVDSLVVLK